MSLNDDQSHSGTEFLPFQGSWLSSPSGNIAYARIINGRLLIPYARNEESKLAGHCYNCRVVAGKLFCRFERFEPYSAGAMLLAVGPDKTLKGGWWLNAHIPPAVQNDVFQFSE